MATATITYTTGDVDTVQAAKAEFDHDAAHYELIDHDGRTVAIVRANSLISMRFEGDDQPESPQTAVRVVLDDEQLRSIINKHLRVQAPCSCQAPDVHARIAGDTRKLAGVLSGISIWNTGSPFVRHEPGSWVPDTLRGRSGG